MPVLVKWTMLTRISTLRLPKNHLRSIHDIDDVIVRDEAAVALRQLNCLVPAGVDVIVMDVPVLELCAHAVESK